MGVRGPSNLGAAIWKQHVPSSSLVASPNVAHVCVLEHQGKVSARTRPAQSCCSSRLPGLLRHLTLSDSLGSSS